MKIEQIYTKCLSQGAYYIESKGEVAIIDPLREVQDYIIKAKDNNAEIKYIFETHFHADFVSGHLTLSKKTGAPIIFGPTASPSFKAIIASDNQIFKLGEITIKVIHTPGHTMESTTYLLIDKEGNNHAIFTGDTLFLGDVGRPDLAQKGADITMEDLAGLSFDSLRNKIMTLNDDIIIYPGHGAGSACGKNMMAVTVDTLGNQKRVNYALREDMTKEEFVKELTADLMSAPEYFSLNVKKNKEGYTHIEEVIARSKKAFSPGEFEVIANKKDVLVLDTRHHSDFVKGHIPGAIFIGLKGDFAHWVGSLIINVNQPLLLIVNSGNEEEAIIRLSRVGFDNALGYLKGGFKAWEVAKKEIDTISFITAKKFNNEFEKNTLPVFDVRNKSEFSVEHIINANNTPLNKLSTYLSKFPSDKNFYLHCAGGYRSVIAASILKNQGINNLINISGGINAIKKTGSNISYIISASSNNSN